MVGQRHRDRSDDRCDLPHRSSLPSWQLASRSQPGFRYPKPCRDRTRRSRLAPPWSWPWSWRCWRRPRAASSGIAITAGWTAPIELATVSLLATSYQSPSLAPRLRRWPAPCMEDSIGLDHARVMGFRAAGRRRRVAGPVGAAGSAVGGARHRPAKRHRRSPRPPPSVRPWSGERSCRTWPSVQCRSRPATDARSGRCEHGPEAGRGEWNGSADLNQLSIAIASSPSLSPSTWRSRPAITTSGRVDRAQDTADDDLDGVAVLHLLRGLDLVSCTVALGRISTGVRHPGEASVWRLVRLYRWRSCLRDRAILVEHADLDVILDGFVAHTEFPGWT